MRQFPRPLSLLASLWLSACGRVSPAASLVSLLAHAPYPAFAALSKFSFLPEPTNTTSPPETSRPRFTPAFTSSTASLVGTVIPATTEPLLHLKDKKAKLQIEITEVIVPHPLIKTH